MTKLSHIGCGVQLSRAARIGAIEALLGGLSVGLLPTAAQAQSTGALPMYRCVSADGSSSRMSRTPCAAGETGAARQAVAGTAPQKSAIVHQGPSEAMLQQAQQEEEARQRQRRSQASGGSGRLGRRR